VGGSWAHPPMSPIALLVMHTCPHHARVSTATAVSLHAKHTGVAAVLGIQRDRTARRFPADPTTTVRGLSYLGKHGTRTDRGMSGSMRIRWRVHLRRRTNDAGPTAPQPVFQLTAYCGPPPSAPILIAPT
jgi:hypothetical protein